MFDNPFESSGIDPLVGANVMRAVGVTPADLAHPEKASRMNDIMTYLKGKEGGENLIHRVTAGKNNVDRLGMAWEYVKLREKHDQARESLERITRELEVYER
jgi:hypothetical protein